MQYIETIRAELQSMAQGFFAMIPSLVIGLVLILITWLAARYAVKLVNRLIGKTSIRTDLQQLIETFTKIAVWIIGLMIVASVVLPGVNPGGLIAGLGIGAVAIGFAFQDIFENFLAGVLIMLREKMRIGDLIEVEGVLGKVEKITLRETHVRQLSNELTIMPNSMLFKNPVQILTDETIRRNDLVVGVSYDTDLEQAQQVILDAMSTVDAIVPDRPVVVYAQEFNSSSVDFLVQWYAQSAARDLRQTKSEAVKAIKKALDEAGIEIPFPYVTHTFKEAVPIAAKE